MANVLITGGSGYLGGDLLNYLKTNSPLPQHGTIYALVRSDEQAEKIKQNYNATPLTLDLSDQAAVTEKLLEKQISIVFFLIDAFEAKAQLKFIHALSEVGKKLGVRTHFLHTTGAKLFSGFVGHPTDGVLSDADENLFTTQKTSTPLLPPLQTALNTNCSIIESGEELGVRTYVFAPCIVYGESAGFGNKISIQTKAVIQASKAMRELRKPDELNGTWPVCHVRDNTMLYAQLLSKMLADQDVPHTRQGYYLASPGSVAWSDIYNAAAKALATRGVIDKAEVGEFSDSWVEGAAKALGCTKEFVSFQMGGICVLRADNGPKIGWTPSHRPEHIIEAMDSEVELILNNL